MAIRVLLFFFISYCYVTTVHAANSCQTIFGNIDKTPLKIELLNKAKDFPFSTLKKTVSNQDIKTSRPSLQQLMNQNLFYDRYSSVWTLHPEYQYLRVEMPTNFIMPQPESTEYFRNIFTNIQRDHYSRENLKSSHNKQRASNSIKKAAFLNSILLKSEQGDTAAYTEIDFIQGRRAIRLLDLNLKTRLGYKMNHDDWWALQDYMTFLSDIYQNRLGLNSQQTEMLTKITSDFIDRTTMIHIDEALVNHKVRTIGTSSGILSVESRNTNEALPLEVLHNISVRKFMSQAPSVGIVEIGRFGKKNESPEESLELLKLIVSSIATRPNIEYVVIEVDKARRRLWKRYAFEDIHLPAELQGLAPRLVEIG